MALIFPKTDLMNGLRFADGGFRLQRSVEVSRTRGGQRIERDLAPEFWRAQYLTVPMLHDAALELETDLLTLTGTNNAFDGFDPVRPLPLADTGAAIDGVTVHAIRADRLALRLTGLPAAFSIAKADGLSINDSAGLHYHRAAQAGVASAQGLSPWLDVRPALRPQVAVGMSVVLRWPCARLAVAPNSVVRQRVDPMFATVSWQADQVLA